MSKEFDQWNQKKKRIDERAKSPFYHEREIWWCALGVNIGSEQDGTSDMFRRPVVILKSFGAATCLAVPLSTSKISHSLRFKVGHIAGKEAVALLSQLRVIDVKRLTQKVETLDRGIFEAMRRAIKDML